MIPFTFEDKYGNPQSFASAKDIDEFLEAHQDLANALFGHQRNNNPFAASLQQTFGGAFLQNVRVAVEAWKSNVDGAPDPYHATDLFKEKKFPMRGTPQFAHLEELIGAGKKDRALGAFCAYAGLSPNFQNVGTIPAELMKGYVQGTAFEDAGISPPLSQSALERLASKFESECNSFKSRSEQLAAAEWEAADRRRTDETTALEQFRDAGDSHRSEETKKIDSAISEINDVRSAYQEFMKLKAPVEYWTSKASGHKAMAAKYRCILIVFAFFASVALAGALYGIANHIGNIATVDKPAAPYLAWVGLGIALSTIAFWAGRIIVRLYMSEHHLAIDSEERATMVLTYLALIQTGEATEEDRKIVLGSLFRPTADGIVKDDAAPDLSMGGAISKLLSSK